MQDNSFQIGPDSRMDIKERLLFNILQELVKLNIKIEDLKNENAPKFEITNESESVNNAQESKRTKRIKKG